MRCPPMRFAPYLLCLGLASLAPFACSSTTTTATAVVRPQLVAVDPADFLGIVHCAHPLEGAAGADAGALEPDLARSYVATLFDVTPAADGGVPNPGTPLASSPPTTCLLPVTFAFVVTNHRYLAEVDAYDKNPEELTPMTAGSRQLTADGKPALPRWTATCGGYPPSPDVDAGSGSAGAQGARDAGSCAETTRPPGVVSYATITQTAHDCGCGLDPSQAPSP